jgi:hypothetical protein
MKALRRYAIFTLPAICALLSLLCPHHGAAGGLGDTVYRILVAIIFISSPLLTLVGFRMIFSTGGDNLWFCLLPVLAAIPGIVVLVTYGYLS